MQMKENGLCGRVIWRAATGGRPYGMIEMQERGHGMPCPYQKGGDKPRPYILEDTISGVFLGEGR